MNAAAQNHEQLPFQSRVKALLWPTCPPQAFPSLLSDLISTASLVFLLPAATLASLLFLRHPRRMYTVLSLRLGGFLLSSSSSHRWLFKPPRGPLEGQQVWGAHLSRPLCNSRDCGGAFPGDQRPPCGPAHLSEEAFGLRTAPPGLASLPTSPTRGSLS